MRGTGKEHSARAPHPYRLPAGTSTFYGCPDESDLSYIPSGRLPFSVTGFLREPARSSNGSLRFRLQISDPQTKQALAEQGYGDIWVEMTPKDPHTGRRRWRREYDTPLPPAELEQGSLWG